MGFNYAQRLEREFKRNPRIFTIGSPKLEDYLEALKSKPKRPELSGDMAGVVEVRQKEQAVTRATDSKPILATFGLAACVSLVGYEERDRVGFLTHYDASTDLGESFTDILIALYKNGLTHNRPNRFDVRIVTGWGYDSDARIIDQLRTRVNGGTFFSMRVVEEDTDYEPQGKSIALDTRTGELFSYDAAKNPHTKDLTELERLRIVIPRKADMVYDSGKQEI